MTVYLGSFCALAISVSKCRSQNWLIFCMTSVEIASGVRQIGVLSQFCLLLKMWSKLLHFSASISLSDSSKLAGATVHSSVIFPHRSRSTYQHRQQLESKTTGQKIPRAACSIKRRQGILTNPKDSRHKTCVASVRAGDEEEGGTGVSGGCKNRRTPQ